MPPVDNLLSRIETAFSAAEDRIKKSQSQQMDVYHGRQDRLAQFEQQLDHLRGVWRPRLEAFAKRFGDKVNVSLSTEPNQRAVLYDFKTELARVELRISVMTDENVEKLILNYDLRIIPILMQYEKHAELALPLSDVNEETVAAWIDDRLVQFVETYLSLYENQHYLRDQMVVDPIAKVRFPKFAAGATMESKGTTYYFIGEETRQLFQDQGALAK